jgi:FSR family fosmidomycin resistance protein-like MFS transporter
MTTADSSHTRTDIGRPYMMVLLGISAAHMINDIMQSFLAALYPVLQAEFGLSFSQIGLLALAFMGTASILQPVVGHLTDQRSRPFSLAFGMGSTLCGLTLLAIAPAYGWLLAGAMLIGIGSAIFHPEASRVARAASGGRFGTAQSFFQVGGNAGHAMGPLLAAFIVVPLGRGAVGAFTLLAALGIVILWQIGRWYAGQLRSTRAAASRALPLPRGKVALALAVLILLTLTKNSYTASISAYHTFFVMDRFDLSTQGAQVMLFLFLAAAAAGVMLGGLIGDRFGARVVIWFSILGVLPFSLALPHVGLVMTGVLTVIIGMIISCAFPAIIVFAQELVPGRVGTIAGLFFGFAFGMGGIAAALLGMVADARGIAFVYELCAWLPALGLVALALPRLSR